MIEKGKTYYLQQNMLTMGAPEIDVLTEDKGQEYVAKYRRSVFDVKQKK